MMNSVISKIDTSHNVHAIKDRALWADMTMVVIRCVYDRINNFVAHDVGIKLDSDFSGPIRVELLRL